MLLLAASVVLLSLRVRAPLAAAPSDLDRAPAVALPFADDFEAPTLGTDWRTGTSGSGQICLTTHPQRLVLEQTADSVAQASIPCR